MPDIINFEKNDYIEFLTTLNEKVRSSQIKAVLQANELLLNLYWDIGKSLEEHISRQKWGSSVVEKLSSDLRKEFPDIKGFSRANLFAMKAWYCFFSKSDEKVQQLVRQIPWGHNMAIVNKVKNIEEAAFYLQSTLNNGWSRNVLIHNIDTNLYFRIGSKTHNFEMTLPSPQSELAEQTLKDPYVFDFINMKAKMDEKDIEEQLVKHITEFLFELGAGFGFMGRQYHLEVSGKDYYIDLLFYHTKLKCYIVIELKAGEFKPEYAGKLNFYISAVDDVIKGTDDNQTIGLLLCRTKDKITAEYALKGFTQPIGIAEYQLIKSIPENLKPSLPSVEEIENELQKDLNQTFEE